MELEPQRGLFYLLPTYLWRWVLFGALVGFVGTPHTSNETMWIERGSAAAYGAIAGVLTAVLFAIGQNTLNKPRRRWASWAIGFVTWTASKLAIAAVLWQFQ